LKLGWEIKKDRHAILAMIDPTLHEFEYEGRLRPFIIARPDLKDKVFVTKVYRCSTFALLLTNGKAGRTYVGFKVGGPVPVAPPVNVGAGLEGTWKVHSQSGTWSTGTYDHNKYPYTPLATLRQAIPTVPAEGWREALPLPFTDPDREGMVTYYPPWGELDEEGIDLDSKEKNETA
jgi:hypothetical protein